MKPTRADFLRHLLLLTGTPYIYGGRSDVGVDCSGAVALALYKASAGTLDWRTWWAAKMWTDLAPTISPLPGDLACYGGKGADCEHVMVLVVPEGTPGLLGGLVAGSSGGGKDTTTMRAAMALGAGVHPKAPVRYRRPDDFRGYRSMDSVLREKEPAP